MQTPTDIFATKGIEYLVVIGYLVVLVGFWRMLTKPSQARAAAAARSAARPSEWFRLPEGFFFHPGHTWARPETDDVIRVGMDDFAQQLLGPANAVELPPVGSAVRQGEPGWRIRINGSSVPMLSPVGGQVLAVNRAVAENPAVVGHDPYDGGWLMEVRVPRAKAAMRGLLSGRVARAWMNETIERLRTVEVDDLGVALPDGGVPVMGLAKAIAPEHWEDVAREFLLTD